MVLEFFFYSQGICISEQVSDLSVRFAQLLAIGGNIVRCIRHRFSLLSAGQFPKLLTS